MVKIALQSTTPDGAVEQELETLAASHEVEYYRLLVGSSSQGAPSASVGLYVAPAKYDAVLADLEARGYIVRDRRRRTSA